MNDNKIVIEMSRLDWEKVVDALNYAIEDRQYQASCTQDPEDKANIEACADAWENIKGTIETQLDKKLKRSKKKMSELHGYGICIDDVIKSNDPKRIIRSREDLEPLKRLINMAPNFAADHTMATLNAMEEEILECEYDRNLAHVACILMERMFADDAGGTGLSYILTLVIAECEDIHMTAILDEDCNEFLLFEKRYPWELNEKEKTLTEEDIDNIFRKYVGVLNGDPAEIQHTTIYLGD